MTGSEWKRRCLERIRRYVTEAGIIRLRELKRRTHWERGPQEDPNGEYVSSWSMILWEEALEELQKRKVLVTEWDALEHGWVMLPQFLPEFRKKNGIQVVTTK